MIFRFVFVLRERPVSLLACGWLDGWHDGHAVLSFGAMPAVTRCHWQSSASTVCVDVTIEVDDGNQRGVQREIWHAAALGVSLESVWLCLECMSGADSNPKGWLYYFLLYTVSSKHVAAERSSTCTSGSNPPGVGFGRQSSSYPE